MSAMEFNGMDIVRQALAELKAAGADKAAASLSRGEQSELNVDAGKMSLYRTTVNVSLGLTAHVQTRKGSVSLNKYDMESIRKAAAEAVSMASSSEPDPANDISPARPLEVFSFGTTQPDSPAMYSRLREFIDYASSRYPLVKLEQCILNFGSGQSFYANSNGAEFQNQDGVYDFSAMFTSKDGANASSFNYSGASHRKLDLPLKDWGHVDELMRQSVEQTDPSSVEGSFEGDILITPDCLGSFLGALDNTYMGDYSLITGNSPWKDKLGQPVVSPLFTLRSEPNGPVVETGYPYTGDGFRAENCTLIEGGVLRNFTLGLYGSNKTGKARCPSGGGAPVVEAGDTALADLIKQVKKGVLLARFSGGSPADNGDFSGVAKNSYLVEDGKIVRPITETMVAGNIGAIFSAIKGVSRERINYGSECYPWVLTSGVTISGK
jgi:PmbA protein